MAVLGAALVGMARAAASMGQPGKTRQRTLYTQGQASSLSIYMTHLHVLFCKECQDMQ